MENAPGATLLMPLSTTDLLALLAAIPLAALGGDFFLKGLLGVTSWLRIPRFVMATSLAAFATSSPELTVSPMAALAGQPEIGLGDALGSNVVNIALVLGLALLLGALPVRLFEFRRDFILALTVPILTLILAVDGTLSHSDGILLLALFAIWMALIIRQAMGHRQKTPQADTQPSLQPPYASLLLFVGLACLLLAGHFFCNWCKRPRHCSGHTRLYYWRNHSGLRNLFAGSGSGRHR